ncbi:NAD-dependent epimerase/dehydratase family protein [Candidatus Lokiarchaeum ossiferum]|uniref:NAD-dependent epimerase/dehydratase family protein n=1 Tax=Candidatus Lokiarchaeum ossiferum TaxID=2951803 RepID=UPI00352D5D99
MEFEDKRIIITGDTGLVGSNLKTKFTNPATHLFLMSRSNGIDLTNKNTIPIIDNVDIIIHLAAKIGVPFSFTNPQLIISSNFNMTLNCLEIARKTNAKFIFVSSYLYGSPINIPIDENQRISPHNPYAQSKYLCEKLIEGYYRDFDVKAVIIRPFNLYGIDLQNGMLMKQITDQMYSGKIKLKNPLPKRDYLFIDDFSNLIIKILKYEKFQELEIVNAGFGTSYSVEEIVNQFQEIGKSNDEVIYENEVRKGEILNVVADISKAKKKYNWIPEIDLKSGISKILKNIF